MELPINDNLSGPGKRMAKRLVDLLEGDKVNLSDLVEAYKMSPTEFETAFTALNVLRGRMHNLKRHISNLPRSTDATAEDEDFI